MKILAKAANIFERLESFGALVVGVLLILLMLSISYVVTVRYILGWTIRGIFEWWEYSLLFITFLGSAWVLRRRAHVVLDIAISHLEPRAQVIVNIITSILGIILCLILTGYGAWASYLDAKSDYHIIAELMVPRFPILMAIPLGSFLLSIEFLRRTLRYIRIWKTPSDSDKEQRLPEEPAGLT